jgi:hypothetical protein
VRLTVQLALSVLILLPFSPAQTTGDPPSTGKLAGKVVDSAQTPAPVSGAKITARRKGHASVSIFSNEQGDFVFPSLAAGSYLVEFEKKYFKTDVAIGIEVVAGKTSALKFQMEPGKGSLKEQKLDPCYVGGDLTVDTMQSSVTNEMDECTFRSLPVRNLSDLF